MHLINIKLARRTTPYVIFAVWTYLCLFSFYFVLTLRSERQHNKEMVKTHNLNCASTSCCLFSYSSSSNNTILSYATFICFVRVLPTSYHSILVHTEPPRSKTRKSASKWYTNTIEENCKMIPISRLQLNTFCIWAFECHLFTSFLRLNIVADDIFKSDNWVLGRFRVEEYLRYSM